MTDYYFSEQPNAPSHPKTWDAELKGHSFRFTSDEGVFSKQGIDFGTELLVDSFQLPQIAGPLLDVGCGYGPIGLVLAKEDPTRKVIMVDVNQRAVELARRNVEGNGLSNVQVLHSNLFDHVQETDFAAILSNPPIRAGKRVIYDLFEKAYKHLAPGGEFWTVVRKQQGAASALKKLQATFPEVTVVRKKKGYVIMKCEKKI